MSGRQCRRFGLDSPNVQKTIAFQKIYLKVCLKKTTISTDIYEAIIPDNQPLVKWGRFFSSFLLKNLANLLTRIASQHTILQ